MTNSSGRSFLSYRRNRLKEARLLVQSQHDLGIPTWQDINDLDEEPTEDVIRSVLADPNTANAVLWLTPEVEYSNMIRRVEAPLILRRHSNDDGFFVVPVAAGGLDYNGAASVVEGDIGIHDLREWNIRRIRSDFTDVTFEEEVNAIASRILSRRLRTIHRSLPQDDRLNLVLNTRQASVPDLLPSLLMDWTGRFEGRVASAEAWRLYLLPALEEVSARIQTNAPGRSILASGLLSIPAATALGYNFMAPRRVAITWEQFTPSGETQEWNLNTAQEDSGFQATSRAGDVAGEDLAVLVSVNADVTTAVADSRRSLPSFRAYVHVKPATELYSTELQTSGQAVDVARRAISEVRKARQIYGVRGRVHLFMAVPVGLAMLIGQLLNTLGQVQTYEHIQQGATGYYVPAALLGQAE